MSSTNYKECVPSDNPDYFDGVVRPGSSSFDKDNSGNARSDL
jgi:hypothetical protein